MRDPLAFIERKDIRTDRRRRVPVLISVVLCVLFIPLRGYLLYADDEEVLLEKVEVTGNRVTGERFIRNLITLQEGRVYSLDDLIDEINVSRANLEKTGLFRNIFFDDQVAEDGGLSARITIRVREKNYLRFGPSGYMGIERGLSYEDLSVYVEYVNLYGNGSSLSLEIPYYRDKGIGIDVQNELGPLTLSLGYAYLDDYFLDLKSHTATLGLGYSLSEGFRIGSDAELRSDEMESFLFKPRIELGSVSRRDQSRKSWYYDRFAPYVGFNDDATQFAGFENGFHAYRELFLQIVNEIQLQFAYQDGDVPVTYTVLSPVRGSYFARDRGSSMIAFTDEFHIPWPFDPRLVFVPFLDAAWIGEDKSDILLGGGLGIHFYSRFQNPLIVELAFGRGVMINFSRRM